MFSWGLQGSLTISLVFLAGALCALLFVQIGSIKAWRNKVWRPKMMHERQINSSSSKPLSFSERSFQDFGKRLAHDLKAPVDSIRSITELLKMNGFDSKDPSQDQKEVLKLLEDASIRADQNTKNLIHFFKLPSLKKVKVDLNATLQSVLQNIAQEDKVRVSTKNSTSSANLDPCLFKECFQLLFEDFIEASGTRISSNGREAIIEISFNSQKSKTTLAILEKNHLELNPLEPLEAKAAKIQKNLFLHEASLEVEDGLLKIGFPQES